MDKKSNLKFVFLGIVFISLYVVFLITHYTNNLSLFFDIPAMFFSVIFDFDNPDKHYFMYKAYDNIRLFSNFLLALPFNLIGIPLAGTSILSLSNFFSLSYLIMHFVALVINFLVAKRTKRYDIAVIAFAFYFIFCMPNIIWAVREVHFAVLFYFPLLSYFLSYEKLGKKDLIPISLLLLYLFESFEITAVLGIILFFSLNYLKKRENTTNIWYKVYISFVLLVISLYIPLKIVYFMFHKNLVFSEGFGLQEWINGSLFALQNLFHSNLIIFVFAFIAIVFTIFYKKEFDKKSLKFAIPFLLMLFAILYEQTGFYPSVHREMHNYSIVFWFIYPIIFTLIWLDFKEIKLQKYFISNLLLITFVFGSLNLLWSIHSNIEFGKYTDTLDNILDTSKDGLIEIPQKEYERNKYIYRFHTCFSTMPATVILSDEEIVDNAIVPSSYYPDFKFCFYDKKHTCVDFSKNLIKLQTAQIKPKTEMLDLSIISKELIKKRWYKY